MFQTLLGLIQAVGFQTPFGLISNLLGYREIGMKRASISYIVRSYGGGSAFSRECGVSPTAVYGWLKANSLPLKRAVDIAALYGVSRDLFYDPWHGSEHGSSEIMTDEETQLAVFGKGV
jgi:hypothetical protein